MCLSTTFMGKTSMEAISSSACIMGTDAFTSVATDTGDTVAMQNLRQTDQQLEQGGGELRWEGNKPSFFILRVFGDN